MQCTLKAAVTFPFKEESSEQEAICSESSALLRVSQQVQVSSRPPAYHLKRQSCTLLSGRSKPLMGISRASNNNATYYLRDAMCNIIRDVWICCKTTLFSTTKHCIYHFLPAVLYCLNISNYFRQINCDISWTLLSCFSYLFLKN